jgi:phosphoglycolate phosphatase
VIPHTLVFDWDNTLVDAWAGIVAALNDVFAQFALPPWSLEQGKARIRGSMRDSFPPLFGANWEKAVAAFAPAMQRVHLAHLAALPGTEAMLDVARPWPLAIVSNKAGPFLRSEVEHLGWTARFGAIVGAGDCPRDKPHPDPVWHALAMIGVQPGPGVWYIGDTALDMETAHAAGCTAVLLGDAAHDGGMALMQGSACPPGLRFEDAAHLAQHLRQQPQGVPRGR